MQFDTTTTLIAICTVISVVGVQCLVYWLRDRKSPWFVWFGATFLIGSAGLLVYLLPHKGAEFLVYGGGNGLRLAAFGFLWIDARVFSGRRPEILIVVLCLAIWMALCSIPAFLGSMEARVVGTSAFISMFLVLGAWELWRDRAELLPSRYPAIFTYLSFAVIVALRIPLVSIAPFPIGALPVSAPWLAIYGLVAFMHVSFLAGFLLSMTRERHELEQRSFARSDPLTGLLNRRAFLDEAARANRRRKGTRDPVAVLVLDLDHFKQVNDRHGHDAGDQVLQHFADIVRASTRATDRLYRMGGEEFCFVLPGTALTEAKMVAERIRIRFAENPVVRGADTIRTTVSIGIAAIEQSGFDPEVLRAAGDAAVYEAKARGRNQTVIADATALVRPAAPSAQPAAA